MLRVSDKDLYNGVKTKELGFDNFFTELNDFISKNDFSIARIVVKTSKNKGLSFTFIHDIDIRSIFMYKDDNSLVIEFEECLNVLTISEYANVHINKCNNSIILEDYGIIIYFKYSKL